MMRKFFALLLISVLLSTTLFASDDVKIGILNDEQCPSDNFNDHIYMAPTAQHEVPSACVLTFPRFDVYNEKRYMTEAIMMIDGTEVYLTLGKDLKIGAHAYMNAAQTISVTVDSRETDTTCNEDTEGKCCGTNHSGSLTVRTPKGQKSVPIVFYRGG